MTQFQLLKTRRFGPIFWTQFLGAFTDNFFKSALVILVAFKGLSMAGFNDEQIGFLASAIFIFPFFLFSATAGQLADKLEKSTLIRLLKSLEIGFSLLAAVGLALSNTPILLSVLFLFALQAAFFGPLKYGILPQLLDEYELVGGNGMVETATNLAILIGTILGQELVINFGVTTVSIVLLAVSILGRAAAHFIPRVEPAAPDLRVRLNPLVPTFELLGIIRRQRAVFNSILGISWFWLLGSALISLFPFYAREVLHGGPRVVTLLLAVFSVGVAVGSLLRERLSYGRLELGLVPLGSLGITVFCFDLFLAGAPGFAANAGEQLLGPGVLWAHWEGRRIILDLFALSMFSGFFIVPLYTLIQQRTDVQYRSRVIAGNNIVNAIFMVTSAFVLMGLRSSLHMTIPQVFAVLAVGNALVALYIYTLIPEFFLRFVAYLLAHVLYRLKVRGAEHIPEEGACVLVCNHVSFIDWLIVAAGVRRPVHFVMWYTYAEMPIVRFLFKDAGVIPIASSKTRPDILEESFAKIAEYLAQGHVVCIFPEGRISADGHLNEFRTGIERIIERSHVAVIPMALKGLWGSLFSRHRSGGWKRFLRRPLRAPIELVMDPMILPEDVKAEELYHKVLRLRGEQRC